MADIQGRVDKKNSRNVFSRIFHAQNDKDTIAAWQADLNRLLQIFNVRSVGSALPSLMAPFQTELAIDTNAAATETDRKVTETDRKVMETDRKVTDMRQDVLAIKKSVANKQFSVRHPFSSSANES